MKRIILATALLSTIGLQAQVLNVNNNNDTYLPLNTENTKEITVIFINNKWLYVKHKCVLKSN